MANGLELRSIHSGSADHAVVFVHGVNGHWDATWTNASTQFFWPRELGVRKKWSTYSLQYDAHTNWGTTMPLQERAVSIAEMLRDSADLAGKDIVIVAHSFGGIVSKQMMRVMADDPGRYREVRDRLAGIVFVATPHTGADIATYGNFLKWALASTVTLEDLRNHTPLLNDLAQWYRRAETPRAHVLFETRKMKLGFLSRWIMVVDRNSADPGLGDTRPIPIDADHSEICKPESADARQFESTAAFLDEVFTIPARLASYPRQVAAICYRTGPAGPELLLVRTTGDRWTFPKGHIEPELGPVKSAAGEAFEEAGVSGEIEEKALTHYLHAKQELSDSPDRAMKFCVTAFPLRVTNDKAGKPQRKRSPTWFPMAQAKEQLARDRSLVYQQEFARVVDEFAIHVQGMAR
jgi:8-oxo-dGTP pyrophosphatase MutT (NUDIX family)/predicted alpha/beta hydrolase family esterase